MTIVRYWKNSVLFCIFRVLEINLGVLEINLGVFAGRTFFFKKHFNVVKTYAMQFLKIKRPQSIPHFRFSSKGWSKDIYP